jgi:hypothetical protein
MIGVTATAALFAAVMPLALGGLGGTARSAAGAAAMHGFLLLLSGTITGAVFPVGAGVLLGARREVREAAGGLEAADHAGAALAALVAGVLFIPALGLAGTAWLTLALEGVALGGLLLQRRG